MVPKLLLLVAAACWCSWAVAAESPASSEGANGDKDSKTLSNIQFSIFGLPTNGFEVFVTGGLIVGLVVYSIVIYLWAKIKTEVLPGLEGAAEGIGGLDEKLAQLEATLNKVSGQLAGKRNDQPSTNPQYKFSANIPVAYNTPTDGGYISKEQQVFNYKLKEKNLVNEEEEEEEKHSYDITSRIANYWPYVKQALALVNGHRGSD